MFLVLFSCSVAMSLCPPSSNVLVAFPRYRMRPATFIQCTHIDQGPTLHKACVGWMCGGPERNETQPACMLLHGSAWLHLPGLSVFLHKDRFIPYSPGYFSSSVDSFCRVHLSMCSLIFAGLPSAHQLFSSVYYYSTRL